MLGLDGLPLEFYRVFWTLLSKDFVQVAYEVLQSGSLAVSQHTGVIQLLYKKGKRSDLNNWRPISLLNVDYKIISKALANRLKRVLPQIIYENQLCCILDRTIFENCSIMCDAIHLCETTNTPAVVISLDQKKAFDGVSWEYMLAALEKFGFGPVFRSWIRALYQQVDSHVIVNNWLTSKITLG